MKQILFTTIAALVLVLCLVGCSKEKVFVPFTDNSPSLRTLEGDFNVYYTLQTSASSTQGTGNQSLKVNTITFHKNYVVIEGDNFGGRLLPIEKIREFRWGIVVKKMATTPTE